MRKLVAYELLSLDGVAERPDEFVTDWDEVMGENLARIIGTQDAVLFGRRTYDEWAAFWPPSEIEPFATFINGVQKFVLTSTDPELEWPGTTVVHDGLTDFVNELKRQPGGDIGVHGSIELAQALLAANLVDELRLLVAPVLVGQGRKLFEGGGATRLSLTRSVTSPTGYLLLDYDLA
jgi:dihydrofolate reductase